MWNEAEFANFKAGLPFRHAEEQFRCYTRVWDVARARYLIHLGQVPVRANHVDVAYFARLEGIDYPQPENPSPFRDKNQPSHGRSINDLRIARALETGEGLDLSQPLIVIQVEDSDGPQPLLIDGGHRLRYAFLRGISRLPAYVLNPVQSRWIEKQVSLVS